MNKIKTRGKIYLSAILLVAATTLIGSCKKSANGNSDLTDVKGNLLSTLDKPFFSGLLNTPQDVLDKLPQFNSSNKPQTEAAFPSTYTIPTPPVGNQGATSTCVGWAVAYAAWSAERYQDTKSDKFIDNVNIYSPNYLYNRLSQDCRSGLYLSRALDSITTPVKGANRGGNATLQSLPFANDCRLALITPSLRQNAANHRIEGSEFFVIDQATRQNTLALKMLLKSNHPIIAAVTLDTNNMKNQPVWNTYGFPYYSIPSGFLTIQNLGKDIPYGGHAVVVVGYDDSKHAFKVQNSWGDKWGANRDGFFWIDYDFFGSGTYVNEVLGADKNNNAIALQGQNRKLVVTEAYVILKK